MNNYIVTVDVNFMCALGIEAADMNGAGEAATSGIKQLLKETIDNIKGIGVTIAYIEQGNNMTENDIITKHPMISWCVYCGHLATAPAAGDLTCIRCLRGIINDNLDKIAQPVNYKGPLHE